jgi:hypothetical protein
MRDYRKWARTWISALLSARALRKILYLWIGWFIVNIQSDIFWHRCLERQTFGTPRMYTLSLSKSIKRSNYRVKLNRDLHFTCILCLLNNTCVQHNFKSVHVSNLFWSREYNGAKEICKYPSGCWLLMTSLLVVGKMFAKDKCTADKTYQRVQ